jgi:hypothetical protein
MDGRLRLAGGQNLASKQAEQEETTTNGGDEKLGGVGVLRHDGTVTEARESIANDERAG